MKGTLLLALSLCSADLVLLVRMVHSLQLFSSFYFMPVTDGGLRAGRCG